MCCPNTVKGVGWLKLGCTWMETVETIGKQCSYLLGEKRRSQNLDLKTKATYTEVRINARQLAECESDLASKNKNQDWWVCAWNTLVHTSGTRWPTLTSTLFPSSPCGYIYGRSFWSASACRWVLPTRLSVPRTPCVLWEALGQKTVTCRHFALMDVTDSSNSHFTRSGFWTLQTSCQKQEITGKLFEWPDSESGGLSRVVMQRFNKILWGCFEGVFRVLELYCGRTFTAE
jgi:hypothetical protein